MSEPDEAQSWHPRYKLIQWSAALILLLLLLGGFLLGRFAPPMGQLAFCAFGVFTGAAFAPTAGFSSRYKNAGDVSTRANVNRIARSCGNSFTRNFSYSPRNSCFSLSALPLPQQHFLQ